VTYLVEDLIHSIEQGLRSITNSLKQQQSQQRIKKNSTLQYSIVPPESGLGPIDRENYVDRSMFYEYTPKQLIELTHDVSSVVFELKSLSIGKCKRDWINSLGPVGAPKAVRLIWEYNTSWMICELYRTTFQLFRPEKKKSYLLNSESYLADLFNYMLNLGSQLPTWFDRMATIKAFVLETRERYVDSNVKGYEKIREHPVLNSCPAKYLAQVSTMAKALPAPPTSDVDMKEWVETFRPLKNQVPGEVRNIDGKIVATGTAKEYSRALNTIPNGLQDIKNLFRSTEQIATPANLSWLKHSGAFERSIKAGGALKVLSTMIPAEIRDALHHEPDVLERLKAQIKIFEGLLAGSLDQLADYVHDCPTDARKCVHPHPPLLHLPVLSRGFKARHLTMGPVAIRFIGSVIQKFCTKWLRHMPVTAELLQPNANWARSINRAHKMLKDRFPNVYFHSGDLVGCTNHYLKEVSQAMILKGLSFFKRQHPDAEVITKLVLGYFHIYLGQSLDLRFRDAAGVLDGFEGYLDLLQNSQEDVDYFMQLMGQHMGMPLSFPVMGGMHQALYDVVYPPERYDLDFASLFEPAHTASSPIIRQILGRACHHRCAGKVQVQLGVNEDGELEHSKKVCGKAQLSNLLNKMTDHKKRGKLNLTAFDQKLRKEHMDYQRLLVKGLVFYREELSQLRVEFPDLEFTVVERNHNYDSFIKRRPDTADGKLTLLPELSETTNTNKGKPYWENKSAGFVNYQSHRKVKNIQYEQVWSTVHDSTIAITLVIEFSIKVAKVERNLLWASDSEVEGASYDHVRDLTMNGRYLIKSATYQRMYQIADQRVVSTGKLFFRESDGTAHSAGDDLEHVTGDLKNVQLIRTRGTHDFNQTWNKKADYCSTVGYVVAERLGRLNKHTDTVYPEFYIKLKQLVADPAQQNVDSWMERATSIRTQMINEFGGWTYSLEMKRHLYRIIENAEEIFYYNNKKSIDFMVKNSIDPRLEQSLGGCGVWKGIQTGYNELTMEHLKVLTYLAKYNRQLLPKYVKHVRKCAVRNRVSRSLGRTKQIVKPGINEIPRKEFKELYFSLLGWVDQLADETAVDVVKKETVAYDLQSIIRLWANTIKSYSITEHSVWGEIKKGWIIEYLPTFMEGGIGIPSPVTLIYRAGNPLIKQGTMCDVEPNDIANRFYGDIDLAYIRDHIDDDPRVMLVDKKSYDLYHDLISRKQELQDEISAQRSEGRSAITAPIMLRRTAETPYYEDWEVDPEPENYMNSLRMAARLRAHNQGRRQMAPEAIRVVNGLDLHTETEILWTHIRPRENEDPVESWDIVGFTS
jgi:predicted ester cyclase